MNVKKSKTLKILLLAAIIVLLIVIILFIHNTRNSQNKNKLALSESVPVTLIGSEPNIPKLSAGMIPVKWNGNTWIITTVEDNDWYDYSNGIPAYVMLNDGYYKSELERGIDESQLAENNVGVSVPDDPSAAIHTRFNLYVGTSFRSKCSRRNSLYKRRNNTRRRLDSTRLIYA